MTVLVQPGTYDQTNGETFSIAVTESISLVGMDWEACIIRGHRSLGYEEAIEMFGKDPVFRKFTVQQGEPADPAWNVAIHLQAEGGLVDSIRNVTMTGFVLAMSIGGHTDVMIEDCAVVDNEQGIRACCHNDTANVANPDLGGGARGCAGGNIFSGYTNYALVNGTSNTIYARGNTWENIIPVEDIDYKNDYDGRVVTQ